MDKNIKQISVLCFVILLIFTIFSLAKIHGIQNEQTSETGVWQSADDFILVLHQKMLR